MPTPAHQGIEAANREFMEAVRTGDEQRFVSLYDEDAILLLPGRNPLIGLTGVRTFFAGFSARGVREIKLSTLEVEVFGGTAWERGSSVLLGADDAVLGRGNYIVIWKEVAGEWR